MPNFKNSEADSQSFQSRPDRRDSQARASARSRRGKQQRLSVRGDRRDTPDIQKIARAVVAMALAQAEAEAQAAQLAELTTEQSDTSREASSE